MGLRGTRYKTCARARGVEADFLGGSALFAVRIDGGERVPGVARAQARGRAAGAQARAGNVQGRTRPLEERTYPLWHGGVAREGWARLVSSGLMWQRVEKLRRRGAGCDGNASGCNGVPVRTGYTDGRDGSHRAVSQNDKRSVEDQGSSGRLCWRGVCKGWQSGGWVLPAGMRPRPARTAS